MTTLPAAFAAKTRPATDCVVWIGAQNSKGYGCFAIDRVSHLAHRLAWEAVNGPIPDGMTLDHLCRVRSCVNVDHLEVVSNAENVRRAKALAVGDTCSRGHLIAKDSDIYRRTRGGQECRTCRREASARDRQKRAS